MNLAKKKNQHIIMYLMMCWHYFFFNFHDAKNPSHFPCDSDYLLNEFSGVVNSKSRLEMTPKCFCDFQQFFFAEIVTFEFVMQILWAHPESPCKFGLRHITFLDQNNPNLFRHAHILIFLR